MKLDEFNALTISDFPLIRHFHESVGQDFARRLAAIQKSVQAEGLIFYEEPSDKIFRLACDLSHLESPHNDNMRVEKPVNVTADFNGRVVETDLARDITNSNIVSMLETAAVMGHKGAMFMASWHYYAGRGRDASRDTAIVLARAAAKAGHEVAAQYLKEITAPPAPYERIFNSRETVFRRPLQPR